MENTNTHNQGYWFVLREDQGNVIFSSNVNTAQDTQILPEQEARYIIDTGSRHFVPAAVVQPAPPEDSENGEKALDTQPRTKEDYFWDRDTVKVLLTLCLENKDVDKDTLWEEIGRIIGASPEQCSSKYRHLRRTYLRTLRRKRMGKDVKWIHFDMCEALFADLRGLPPTMLEPWEETNVRKLLTLYIENLPRFRNPNCLQKELWREIGIQLGTPGYNCYHKFRSLKRSYLNWLNRSRETGKGIKWLYHQYFERIYYGYNPKNRSWDHNKIKLLLDSYAQIAHKFRNPKLQKKELWKEIAGKVGETPTACDKKFRNLKLTYARVKLKSGSRSTVKWRYFRDFENIYGYPSRYIDCDGVPKVVYQNKQDEHNYINQLLEYYIANKDKFRDTLVKNRTLWKPIGRRLGLTPDECDKKFRNLKQTYIRLAFKKKQTGVRSRWPYFKYFERIYEEAGDAAAAAGVSAATGGEGAGGARGAAARFHTLARLVEESNRIQRQRNHILQALLHQRFTQDLPMS